MRALCVFLFLSMAVGGFSQTVKKKLFGEYEGTIPRYAIAVGTDVVDVSAVTVRVSFRADGLTQEIGNVAKAGTWKITATEKAYFVLDVTFEGQVAHERYIVYKKGKRLLREGLFPQPDATLRKK